MSYPILSQGANLASVRLRSENGTEIGQVKEWMMDVDKGQVVYVLAQFDSLEGLVTIPWQFMDADKEKGGYKVNLSPDELERAPKISREKIVQLVDDKSFLDTVFDNFKASKYWDSPQSKSPGEIHQRENIELSEGKGYDHPDPGKF